MKIKIIFDADGVYGKGEAMDGQQLVRDYIECLNEVEDASTIAFLKSAETGKAVDFVAELWGLDYEVVEF